MSKKLVTTYTHTPETIRFIQTLVTESTAMLIRHGETGQTAKQLSALFVADVCKLLSGSVYYFGKNISLNAQSMKEIIRAGHNNGESINQLAKQHGLSGRRIYDILFYEKDKPAAKAATKSAPMLAVSAMRIFLKAGISKEDSKEAARGLLAVLTAKFGGGYVYIPSQRRAAFILRDIDIFNLHKSGKSKGWLAEHFLLSIQDIDKIIENYPAPATPGRELPLVKKKLAGCTAELREYMDVNPADSTVDVPEIITCLEAAAEQISRAEEIISRLKG